MNQREVFKQVSDHLLTQDLRSYSFETDECYYRVDKTVGHLACAIGCLINDEHYSEELEHQSIDSLQVQSAVALSLSTDKHKVFISPKDRILLNDLQHVHDFCSPEIWKYQLNDLSTKYFGENLTDLGVTA